MTEAGIRRLLNRALAEAGTQADLARACGVTTQYLTDVFKYNKSVGPKLLSYLGYERYTAYRKIKEN